MNTIIGVDPAFRKGGFAVCVLNDRQKTVEFFTCDLLYFHDWIRESAPVGAVCVIENSNAQNVSFDTTGNSRVVSRKARNVGTNQAISQLAFVSAVRALGPDRVFSISPKEKGAKITDRRYFAALLQADGIEHPAHPVNQDMRDAYKVATIGRNKLKILQYAQQG